MLEWFFNPASHVELMAYVSSSLEISIRGSEEQVQTVFVYDYARRVLYRVPATSDQKELERGGRYRLFQHDGWLPRFRAPFKEGDKQEILRLLNVALGSRQAGEVLSPDERKIWSRGKAAVNAIRLQEPQLAQIT